jgi:exodeoxyribonuclease V beta subunit
MASEHFDPVTTELHTGISLIEASAGTGKTYTIAMLVLRLVVEQSIPIDKVLVVTFTKAATEELKDRIRSRLADAKRALTSPIDLKDKSINAWLAQLAAPPEQIKRRIDLALLDIDQAGIFTIHGFCQRVLREHALSSGQLFDAELTDDLDTLKQACADDFWRRNVQNRSVWEISALTNVFKTSDVLLKSIGSVSADALVLPDLQSMDEVLGDLKRAADIAKYKLANIAQIIDSQFLNGFFKPGYVEIFSKNCPAFSAWLQSDSHLFPDTKTFALFTYAGLLDGLNGQKFRTNKNQTGEERKAEFLASLGIATKPFDDLAGYVQQINVMLRRNLLATLHQELDEQLEQNNLWSFDYLITHLAQALQGGQSRHLTHELRQRFNAALIDEFQDTDNYQWHIFSSVFAVAGHYLVLVGDPKQAIYKFRGADIYSYLEAQSQAQYHYTLGFNWRSHPNLVVAVNRFFQRPNAFLLPDIEFNPTQAARTALDGSLHYRDNACAPMMLWQLPENDSKTGFWQTNHNQAATLICTAVVNEIVGLLTEGYSLQPESRTIKPQDIAILVRTNKQAKDYQQALHDAGVPSVLNNTESVFASEEAVHLLTLLQAIAHPGDMGLFGQALALSWFGFDGQTLYRIQHSETELDAILSRFLGYYQTWQQKGVMAMMQMVLNQEAIATTLTKSTLAERHLTNLQHILELLQEAVIEDRLGIHKTLNWLKVAISKAQQTASGAENQQLRLESDADAVKIITMHRAKGLEYPIVFCPFLWQRKDWNDASKPLVKCHLPAGANGKTSSLIVDLGSPDLDKHQAQADFEEHSEELRLAYVALTRAKYRCYVAWANARTDAKPNDSALAYLLDFAEQDFSGQQTVLYDLQKQHPQAFAYRLLDSPEEITGEFKQAAQHLKFQARIRQRKLHTVWQMSSYTALSALSLSESPELPKDKAGEHDAITQNIPIDAAKLLPAGVHTGNVVHDLLENIPFNKLAKHEDITELRDKACQRYGLKLAEPGLINTLLYNTVSTPLSPLDNMFCLANVADAQCLKEMPFYLSMPSLSTQRINAILKHEPSFQLLNDKQMSGYLTGFIDLICEYDHRYYVMDYKTNLLPDYQADTLTHAMREHNYGLQYWLYCVVLHRYLHHRLPDYSFADHFGGVRYLFVRGMEPEQAMSGVFENTPDLSTLTALASVLREY